MLDLKRAAQNARPSFFVLFLPYLGPLPSISASLADDIWTNVQKFLELIAN
jgi:hypothetical protein